ncbi:DUF6233 domain-containing protein [Streptomyces sp. NPDC093591]|uniref:DUF6233 domain-containing protein n=1 Tax=Streptomyces sp. NPDC093591 TaxID=3366044 RepID=UPI00381EABFD
MAGKRRRAVSRDEARRLLAAGLGACSHCQPDTQLHILDLADPRQPAARFPEPPPIQSSTDARARLEQSCHAPGYPEARTAGAHARRSGQDPR